MATPPSMDGSQRAVRGHAPDHRLRARSPTAVEVEDRPPLARHPPGQPLRRVDGVRVPHAREQRCPRPELAYTLAATEVQTVAGCEPLDALGGGRAHEGRAGELAGQAAVLDLRLAAQDLVDSEGLGDRPHLGRDGRRGQDDRVAATTVRPDQLPHLRVDLVRDRAGERLAASLVELGDLHVTSARHHRRDRLARGLRPTTEAVLHRSPEVTQTRPAGRRSDRFELPGDHGAVDVEEGARPAPPGGGLDGGDGVRELVGAHAESVIHICTGREWDYHFFHEPPGMADGDG